ncbi:hypothetical protein Tco_1241130 [Tanacetum coccineum]
MGSRTLGSRVPATSAFLSPRTRGTLPLASRPATCNLVPFISRHLCHLVPITSRHLHLMEYQSSHHVASCHWTAPATWRKVDPHDTSLLTSAGQVKGSTGQVNRSGLYVLRVGSGCHVSPPEWIHVAFNVALRLIARPAKARLKPETLR